MVSVIIPSRNEPYLQKTVEDILAKAKGEIEVIVILDGYWPNPIIRDDPRIILIHRGKPRGMRNAINSAVAIAKGDYLLKCDAHVMFGEGFDTIMAEDCQDNWVMVPRRYGLDVEKWERNNKAPIDYMYLSNDLHGKEWGEKNNDPKLKEVLIDDLMSAQGSCWFMKKSYFHELELMDEEHYGTFWQEFQEIGLKAWLSGGAVKVTKKTWYAHWHKPKEVGRGYSLSHSEQKQTAEFVNTWFVKGWHKQVYDMKWLVDKFGPVPSWPTSR